MLIDSYNRVVDYLRVSITQRCNFRCLYCMPETPFNWVPKENLLSYEELFDFIKIMIDNGVNKIKITGGEPLVRENLDRFIKMIVDYNGSVDLALTTNGYLLKSMAKDLKESGLKRVNISLDSLKSEVAFKLAQKDILNSVLNGIDEALRVGLSVKLNSVILKDRNDNEILELFEFAKERDITIRFIEFMENLKAKNLIGVDSQTILDEITKKYNFKELPKEKTPARYFVLDSGYKFGVIEPYKENFCESCNRIRLTAEGFLIPCLYFDEAKSIKDSIRAKDFNKSFEILNEVLKEKPKENRWGEDVSNRAFYETGG